MCSMDPVPHQLDALEQVKVPAMWLQSASSRTPCFLTGLPASCTERHCDVSGTVQVCAGQYLVVQGLVGGEQLVENVVALQVADAGRVQLAHHPAGGAA